MEAILNEYDQHALERLCDKLEEVDGCYEYQGAITDNGYGFIWYKGRNHYAHRIAWLIENGEIPQGMLVLHECDNRRCVRVKHLFLGTHQDNTSDMIAKGRQVIACGEAKSAFKESTIRLIKQELKAGITQREIGRRYGMTRENVSAIARGLSWRHV